MEDGAFFGGGGVGVADAGEGADECSADGEDGAGEDEEEGEEAGGFGGGGGFEGGGAGGGGGEGDGECGEDGLGEGGGWGGGGEVAFEDAGDLFAEHFAATGEALADGFFGDFEGVGDGGGGLGLAVVEDHGVAVGLGDLGEGAPEEFAFFGEEEGVGGLFGDGGGLLLEGVDVGGFGGVFAGEVDEAVAGDLAEPGGEFGGIAEGVEGFPGGEEGFLCEVFAAVEVSAGGVGEAGDERLVTLDDVGEGLAVAEAGGGEEGGVGGGGSVLGFVEGGLGGFLFLRGGVFVRETGVGWGV